MKDLKPIKGLKRLLELIAQGEHEHQDFKYLISDARKIARSISAFANNDGGRLLIGVKDNGVIAGVRSEEDLYMIEQAAQRYCTPQVEVNFSAIKAGQGVVVYIASIPRVDYRPVYVVEDANTRHAYYRVADENIVAHPIMIEAWKMRSDATGSVISITEGDGAILAFLNSNGRPATATEIAIAAHLSQRTTDASLTRLASQGLVQFVYTSHQFKITLPTDISETFQRDSGSVIY